MSGGAFVVAAPPSPLHRRAALLGRLVGRPRHRHVYEALLVVPGVADGAGGGVPGPSPDETEGLLAVRPRVSEDPCRLNVAAPDRPVGAMRSTMTCMPRGALLLVRASARNQPSHPPRRPTIMDKLLTYAKSVVAAVGVVVTLVQAAVADQAVSLDEAQGVWTAVLAAVTVAAVYAVPNKTPS